MRKPSASLNTAIGNASLYVKLLSMAMIIAYHYLRDASARGGLHQWVFDQDLTASIAQQLATNNPALVLLEFFGFLGVPLFFMLSGWGLTISTQRSGIQPKTLSFLRQRIPALWVPYAIAAIIWYLMSAPPGLIPGILVTLTFTQWITPHFFFGPNSPLWFIAILAWLYLFFPLLYLWIRGSLHRLIVIFVAAYACALICAFVPQIAEAHPLLSQGALPLTRLGDFALGIWLAQAGDKITISHRLRFKLGAIALIALGVFFLSLLNETAFYIQQQAFLVFFTSCLLMAPSRVRRTPSSVDRRLSLSMLYACLWHRPIAQMTAANIADPYTLVATILFVGCSLFTPYLILLGFELEARIKERHRTSTQKSST